jgi:hypothetical protein
MAVTMNVALEEPAAIVTGVGTVATEVLLLERETVAPCDGAGAVRLTVPSSRFPAATLVALKATLDTTGDVLLGPVVDEPPQSDKAIAAAIVVTRMASGVWMYFRSFMRAVRYQQRCHEVRWWDLAAKGPAVGDASPAVV